MACVVPDALFGVFRDLGKEPSDVVDTVYQAETPEKPASITLIWKNASDPFALFYQDAGQARQEFDDWNKIPIPRSNIEYKPSAPQQQQGGLSFDVG